MNPIPLSAKFSNDSLSTWCSSVAKDDDGMFHLYYSTWPKRLGWAWVTDSKVSHAVAKSQYGPYKFADVALPVRGAQYWDGLCTHNPTIHKFGKKYYLYYMGNTGDGINPNGDNKAIENLNWTHRNNQRIGVAISDSPYGPWKRFDQPLVDVSKDSTAMDALAVNNPAVAQGPDGRYLMVYKAIGRKRPLPFGGPVVHMVAFADHPAGPFKKYAQPVFTVKGNDFPAEDPYIWYQAGKYRAIVKKMENDKNGKEDAMLVQYESANGLDWVQSKQAIISDKTITWVNERVQKLTHLERPQLYIENGKPVTLLCAGDTLDAKGVRQTFNVQIPISVTEK
ncbi:glycoside hydrolase family protein [Pedobacter frigoris]|uniref:glycoside hydrolase family protein n=1 Tax=Pedobacter frigoris TaxID=2571272 RepID=UPI00292F62F9|nr:glycoside hydrolase family protein [Pedobacter frigoris]